MATGRAEGLGPRAQLSARPGGSLFAGYRPSFPDNHLVRGQTLRVQVRIAPGGPGKVPEGVKR